MVDFGSISSDYARYRVAYPSALFDRLARFEIGLPGQVILDLGAGTGLFGCVLTARQCAVTSVDYSFELLTKASGFETLDCSRAHFRRVVGRAEAIPFIHETFDVVAAAQCWHWFDRALAPREIHRVLRPHGRVAVIYQSYLPLPGSIAEQTEKLILRHRPRWRHANSTGINGQALRDLQINGFDQIESFSFDQMIEFSHASWRGYIRAHSVIGASMSPAQRDCFDVEHAEMLRSCPDTISIPHRIFVIVARKHA